MNNIFSSEILKAMDKAESHSLASSYIIMPKWWVEEETMAHPERFGIANDEDRTMTWCGYIVYSCRDIYDNKE